MIVNWGCTFMLLKAINVEGQGLNDGNAIENFGANFEVSSSRLCHEVKAIQSIALIGAQFEPLD